MSAHHASATLPAPRFSRAQTWTVLFLFFTGIAFLSFNYKYLDDLARQQGGTLLRRLLEETTGVYSFFILLPIAFHFAHIYLFERKGWLRQALMHLATGVGFSVAHTMLMALSRRVFAPLSAGNGNLLDRGRPQVLRARQPGDYRAVGCRSGALAVVSRRVQDRALRQRGTSLEPALHLAAHRFAEADLMQLASEPARTSLVQVRSSHFHGRNFPVRGITSRVA